MSRFDGMMNEGMRVLDCRVKESVFAGLIEGFRTTFKS